MKWVLLSLLGLNLAFLAFNFLGGSGRGPADTPQPLSLLNNIRLVKAVEADSNSQENIMQCLELGPFDAESFADQASRRLASLDIRSRKKRLSEKHIVDYTLYLGPYPSPEGAGAAVRKLLDEGHDGYVSTSANGEDIVVLGVFNRTAEADVRLKEIRGDGYSPSLRENVAEKPVFWLFLDKDSAEFFNSRLLKSLQEAFPDINSKITACL